MDGLMRLRRPEQVAELRGLSVKEVLGLNFQEAVPANGEAADVADPGTPASGQSPDHRSSQSDSLAEDVPADQVGEEPDADPATADAGASEQDSQ
jgi:hypothetical protein